MCTCNQKTVTLKSFVCISRGERWAWFYKRSGKKPNGRPTCAEKSNFGYRNSLPFSFCILFSGFVLLSRFCCSLLQCSSMGKKSGRSAAKNIQNAYPFGWETDTHTHTFEKKKPGIPGNQMEFFSFRIECELYLQSVFFFFASHIYQLVEFALTHFRHPVEWNLASAQDRGESMEQHIAPA